LLALAEFERRGRHACAREREVRWPVLLDQERGLPLCPHDASSFFLARQGRHTSSSSMGAAPVRTPFPTDLAKQEDHSGRNRAGRIKPRSLRQRFVQTGLNRATACTSALTRHPSGLLPSLRLRGIDRGRNPAELQRSARPRPVRCAGSGRKHARGANLTT